MTDSDKKLAEEILDKIIAKHPMLTSIDSCYRKIALETMQEYHESKLKEELIMYEEWYNQLNFDDLVHETDKQLIDEYLKQREDGDK